MVTINLPYTLHPAQGKIFDDHSRFRVCVNGRRFGKTALGVNELLIRALSFQGTVHPRFPVTVLGALPTANQARKVIWEPLRAICESPGFDYVVKDINRTAMTILLLNGVTIRIAGANDNGGDRLRGLKLYFVWFDETQDIKPVSWSEVVRPAMSDTPGSRALFTGTPKGKQNWLYDLSQRPVTDKDWAFFTYPTWTNPTIPKEEIETARLTMPPRLFAQEYEASFVDFPGKFYTELTCDNKWYGALPKFDLVVMGIDWGDIHPALCVLGRCDNKWYWVEGWSPNRGREVTVVPDTLLSQHIKRLSYKWNVRFAYADPSRPSSILASRDLVNCVAGYNKVAEGIGQVHGLITQNKLLFAPGHADKIPDAIDGDLGFSLHEAYHRVVDKSGNFTDEPADGYFSHICDATRYALATKVGSGG